MDVAEEKRLVEMIQAGGRLREQALSNIYNDSGIKDKLTHMITNNHGNTQDGEDLYQEAMIVLDKNIRSGDFRVEGSLTSYLYSIGKYLWMNHLRKKSLTLKESFSDQELISSSVQPDNLMMDEQRKEYLKNLLSKLGTKCQNILEMWQLSYSMEEIANALKLTDSSTARKAKYDCQQQLIKLIQSNPHTKNELK
ncbi:MAG: sigma-70 family RNA polymerase sigma factor [Saprospiraceae bacterium]|jgi:RNA polymerase sigma factor (sigma-70 family)|nr:sigma-70 family RNA polymerase sigma factor [Saprospiraceae bacterium]MBK6480755.1 sigma-70 family RNA polymerase sigma factor [Saprospiraceae bacterium]MBK6816887.1 sigma-70 family RNA polymerase sigma factor [Saprospiraceae bacterium]MBK7371415.1 sigma-70 family RNA polymerase sigma factor [Saprospiraceae bacterium]MBK7436090.1 sigma-70 family RNA polymerase sigma factor [Saprospiraceae bacterium]